MRNILYQLIILCICLSACQPAGEVFENAICIQNITTIDAEKGLKANQTVVISEGKIIKIATTSELKLSSENEILDGSGKYLIPGLWDAHVHYAYIEELAPYMSDLFLAYGITSLRDTGGEIMFMRKWKEESEKNPTSTPRLMIAGPLLDGMPNVYDGSSPDRPPLSHGLADVKDVNEYIDYLDSLGVDFLKAYEMLRPEQFLALLAKAKEKGLKVTGHVPLSMDAITASNAGLHSMEHLRNLEMVFAKNPDELLKKRVDYLRRGMDLQGGDLRSTIHRAQRMPSIKNSDPQNEAEVIRVLAKNQTVQIPTLALTRTATFRNFTERHWQQSYDYMPDSIEVLWRASMDQILKAPRNADRETYADWMVETVGKLHAAGVPIMAGTDTPIGFLTPGLSLHEELKIYVDAGMTPLEALASATTTPAKWFDMENELGLIKEGMLADLLILDANPLDDIRNTREINSVIKAGALTDRARLISNLKQD